MATAWTILTALALIVSAASFKFAMYPTRTGAGAFRGIAGVVTIGSGALTVIALKMAQGGF